MDDAEKEAASILQTVVDKREEAEGSVMIKEDAIRRCCSAEVAEVIIDFVTATTVLAQAIDLESETKLRLQRMGFLK